MSAPPSLPVVPPVSQEPPQATAGASALPRSLGFWSRTLAVPVIWGGTFTAGKVAVLAMPVTLAAFGRYALAVLALLLMVRWFEGNLAWPLARQALATFVLGATGIAAYNLCFLAALERIDASRASMIIALNPVVTTWLGVIVLGERMRPLRWFGALLALAGVWIVVSGGDPLGGLGNADGLGELLMLGAISSWAVYTVVGRIAMRGLSPLAATTWASIWGCGLLGVAAAWDLGSGRTPVPTALPGAEVIVALLYLGVAGTAIAFVWYYQAVRTLGAGRAVVFNNLVPLAGASIGVFWLGETLSASLLVGGGIAIAGVMITTLVRER